MRVKTVTFAQLRNTGRYENQRAEATIEVNEGEDVEEAYKLAKKVVRKTLGLGPTQEELDKAREVLESAE
jgi:hypothetical protein